MRRLARAQSAARAPGVAFADSCLLYLLVGIIILNLYIFRFILEDTYRFYEIAENHEMVLLQI